MNAFPIPIVQSIIAFKKITITYVTKYYNKFKVSLFGKSLVIGKDPIIIGGFYLKIAKKTRVSIGDNFILTSGNNINPISRNIKACLCTSSNGEIIIGNNVKISSSTIWSFYKITIGDNVQIGANCIILDSDCHSLNFLNRRISSSDFNNTIYKEVVICDDVLIGTNSIILKGVSIGARSIIGAGSVVTKNIPPDCIAAGNPCKVLKKTSINKI